MLSSRAGPLNTRERASKKIGQKGKIMYRKTVADVAGLIQKSMAYVVSQVLNKDHIEFHYLTQFKVYVNNA